MNSAIVFHPELPIYLCIHPHTFLPIYNPPMAKNSKRVRLDLRIYVSRWRKERTSQRNCNIIVKYQVGKYNIRKIIQNMILPPNALSMVVEEKTRVSEQRCSRS